MKILAPLTLLLALTSSAQTPERTKQDTNREVVRTYAQIYLDEKDYARTEMMISDYLTQDENDGALWMLLGQSQVQERKYAQACHAFQKASSLFTEKDLKVFNLYQFADCLNRGGQQPEAISVLKHIASYEGPVAVAANDILDLIQKKMIRAGDALPPYVKAPRGQYRVSGGLGVGFDTNVLLVEEDVAKNTSVSDRGSFFLNPAVQLGYVGKGLGTIIDTRYMASFTDYLNASAKSYNSLYQRGDLMLGTGEQRFGVFGDILFMNRNPFQIYDWTGGVIWVQNRRLDSKHAWDLEIPLRYQSFPLDAKTAASNDRTGEGVTAKVRYRSTINQVEGWMVQAGLDQQLSKGSNYKMTSLNVPAYLTLSLPFFRELQMLNTFTGEVDSQYYWSADPKRRDLTLKGGLGLTRKFGEGWNTSLDYLYSKNLSSVNAARYTKAVIALSLSKDFL